MSSMIYLFVGFLAFFFIAGIFLHCMIVVRFFRQITQDAKNQDLSDEEFKHRYFDDLIQSSWAPRAYEILLRSGRKELANELASLYNQRMKASAMTEDDEKVSTYPD